MDYVNLPKLLTKWKHIWKKNIQKVEYEIQCEQDSEDTFTAIDQHDGGM